MSDLRSAVYIAQPIPYAPVRPSVGGVWSPVSCALIYSAKEAVLDDSPITLVNIYITHGRGDHFFGIPVVQTHFPGAKAVATPQHIHCLRITSFTSCWKAGGCYRLSRLATKTRVTTIPWVPDLKLAVCGDVVYGQVHQMLFEANTRAKRDEWIRAVEKVKALGPMYVVPGHRQAEEIDRIWHLAAPKKYIEDFGKLIPGALRLGDYGLFQVLRER
ncbi:hypothetical protein BDW67DRAFT_192870 [Aspergillus spinulosporus]